MEEVVTEAVNQVVENITDATNKIPAEKSIEGRKICLIIQLLAKDEFSIKFACFTGMTIAYSSLVIMAMLPIFFGSKRSVNHQKEQKVRILMSWRFVVFLLVFAILVLHTLLDIVCRFGFLFMILC